jgi:hypothetical protein
MKKIIGILIVMMTVVCGEPARLESLGIEREAQFAAEQARIVIEANRSYLQIVKDVFYKHSYILYSALIITTVIGSVYLFCYYSNPQQIKEPQQNVVESLHAGEHLNPQMIQQHIAEFAAMEANHTESIIVEINQPVHRP